MKPELLLYNQQFLQPWHFKFPFKLLHWTVELTLYSQFFWSLVRILIHIYCVSICRMLNSLLDIAYNYLSLWSFLYQLKIVCVLIPASPCYSRMMCCIRWVSLMTRKKEISFFGLGGQIVPLANLLYISFDRLGLHWGRRDNACWWCGR